MRLGDIDEDEIVLESEKVALDNSDEKETKKFHEIYTSLQFW